MKKMRFQFILTAQSIKKFVFSQPRIGDFGISEMRAKNKGDKTKNDEDIARPVRWTAPEVLSKESEPTTKV
jgi:hypothetical protein